MELTPDEQMTITRMRRQRMSETTPHVEPPQDQARVRVARHTFVHPISESKSHDDEVNGELDAIFESDRRLRPPTTEIVDVSGVPHLVTVFWTAEPA